MNRRPLPDIEDDVPVERGVGPVATSALSSETTPPAHEGQAAAEQSPPAGPDGTFAAANTGGTQLVPTSPAAPAQTVPPANGQQPGGQPQQGPVYTVPQTDGPPRAQDIIRPKERIEREQISAMVPAELQLVRRMRLLWAHEGIEQRDLVALAVDAELRSRGY